MPNGGGQDRRKRFEEIATTIRNREAGQCRKCGELEGDERLSVHHLISDSRIPEGLDSHLPVNLVALCRTCHAELESKPLHHQLRKMGIENRRELLLSNQARERLNNRLKRIGPDILSVKGIRKEESEEFLDQDFTIETPQTELFDFD